MVANVGSLNVRVGADISDLIAGMGRAQDTVKRSADLIGKSARASAKVFEDAKRKADSLLSSVDPLYAAQLRYDKELAKAQELMRAGALTTSEFAKVQTGLRTQLDSATGSMQGFHKANGMARIGQMELGHAARSTAEMIALGQSPVRALALEMGRLTQGIGFLAGGTSKFAAFMGGPWGIALTAATLVLAPMIGKLFETHDEVEKLIDKMREQARQAALTAQAESAWKSSLEGVRDALRLNREALDKLQDGERDAATQALANALAAKARAEIILGETKANVQLARSLYEVQKARASGPGQRGEIAALGLDQALGSLDAFEAKLAGASDAIKEADKQITEATAAVYAKAADKDDVQRIKDHYAELVKAATAKATLEANAARAAGDSARAQKIVTTELQKQVLALNAQRDAKIKAIEDAKKTHADPGETSAFGLPVNGTVTGRFGESRPGHRHAGVDLAVPVGTSVAAPAGGTVIEAGTLPGYGNVVFIDHGGGTISRLAHLSKLSVVKGQLVDKGDIIGLSGGAKGAEGAGDSTGPHVHYEVRVNGKAVNPLTGNFKTDAAGAAVDAQKAAETAAKKAAEAAEKAQRQEDAFVEQRDQLNKDLLAAQSKVIPGVEAQAQAAEDAVDAERKRLDNIIDNNLKEGKYGDATSELAQARAAQLKAVNFAVALVKNQNIEDQKALKLLQESDKDAEQTFQLILQGLEYQDSIARTQEEHRDLQLKILDVVYQEKEAHLKRLKLIAEGNGDLEEANRIQGLINDLPNQRARDTDKTKRGTMGPLEAWAASVPQTAKEINEALQSIETQGLDGLADAITGVITGTQSLKEAFGNLANSIISDIIRMTIRMLIFKAISGLIGGSSRGLSAGTDTSSFASFEATSGGGGFDIPKFATGGGFTVLGRKGIDRNVMSINGVPIANVSHGERVNIANDNSGGAGGDVTIHQHYSFSGVAVTKDEFVSGLMFAKHDTIATIKDMNRRGRR